jgi:hypothetical protein
MINATVSHEMRGPISSMTMSNEQMGRELKEIKKDLSESIDDLKELEKTITPA